MFFLAASEAEYEKSTRIIRFADTSGAPFSLMLMFRILVLQSPHDLSDDQMEFQIPDGLSFMRFLGLNMEDTVPDAETIWHYRETFINAGASDRPFKKSYQQVRQYNES